MLDGHGESLGPGDPERDPVCADDDYMHVLYGRPAVHQPEPVGVGDNGDPSPHPSDERRAQRAAEESDATSVDYKVLCNEKGEIRVDEFVNPTAIPYFSFIVDGARQAGFDDPAADYVIFYDGNFPGICGIAELHDDDHADDSSAPRTIRALANNEAIRVFQTAWFPTMITVTHVSRLTAGGACVTKRALIKRGRGIQPGEAPATASFRGKVPSLARSKVIRGR